MENIKAVFFDYDNTLGNRYVSAYNTYAEMIDTLLKDVKMSEVEREAMLQDFLTYDQLGNVQTEYSVKRIEEKYAVNFHLDSPFDWWNVHHARNAVLFEDVIPTLLELRKKYKLGIITNGRTFGQGAKIVNTGLDKYVDDYVISEEFHCAKPDPRLYEIACERLQVKPEECVYVGDTFGNDVLGAYRAHMIPIWIWPDNNTRPLQAEVLRINKIGDLLEIL